MHFMQLYIKLPGSIFIEMWIYEIIKDFRV